MAQVPPDAKDKKGEYKFDIVTPVRCPPRDLGLVPLHRAPGLVQTRTYHLKADTEAERKLWVDGLNACVARRVRGSLRLRAGGCVCRAAPPNAGNNYSHSQYLWSERLDRAMIGNSAKSGGADFASGIRAVDQWKIANWLANGEK